MKKTLMALIWIWVLVLILWSFIIGSYNKMITLDETVNTAWSQVENQYQRRLDLIPNLVSTVKWYAAHEKDTLEWVVKARSEALKINIDINNADELVQLYEKQNGLTQALSKLMMLQENYPNLKADQSFLGLQTSLEWTENRIATERMRYNEVVMAFNIYIRKFPTNIFASIFGMKEKTLFSSDEKADEVPNVEF